MSLVAAGIQPNERRGFHFPKLVESLRVPFLVGYLEKRCYLDKARVHIQVPNGEALGLQAFLQELGVQCDIRQKKVGRVVSVVTSSSADTKAFQQIVEPYRHFVRSERLLKVMEKEVKGEVKV